MINIYGEANAGGCVAQYPSPQDFPRPVSIDGCVAQYPNHSPLASKAASEYPTREAAIVALSEWARGGDPIIEAGTHSSKLVPRHRKVKP